jgi:hypothetical protein
MCHECTQLKQLLVRTFGHLQKSDDPNVRAGAEKFRETLRRQDAVSHGASRKSGFADLKKP